jgi:hypothetical protein
MCKVDIILSEMAESKPAPMYLILEAFDNLLINYPYHPVLWTLYAVNRRFAARKPTVGGRNVEILDYSTVSNPWLSGITNALRDIIAIDDKEECWFAYATIRKGNETVLYWIPREWVKRIIVNSRGHFVLLPFEFCCRQVLKRSDCKLVRCQSHAIPPKFLVDQTYFHVGCGPCHQEISFTIAGFNLFVGIKQLGLMLSEKFEVNTELIIALLNCDDKISLKFETANKTIGYDVKASHLCEMLKHILVCKICNIQLEKFLSILDDYISGDTPFNEYFNETVDCEFYYCDTIPCNKYVIDGEFDEMRSMAFNAIKIDDFSTNDVRHKIVDTFIETYCNRA